MFEGVIEINEQVGGIVSTPKVTEVWFKLLEVSLI